MIINFLAWFWALITKQDYRERDFFSMIYRCHVVRPFLCVCRSSIHSNVIKNWLFVGSIVNMWPQYVSFLCVYFECDEWEPYDLWKLHLSTRRIRESTNVRGCIRTYGTTLTHDIWTMALERINTIRLKHKYRDVF